MKRNLLKNIFLSLCLVVFPMGMAAKQEATVTSPSGNLTLTAGVDKAGRPYYSLSRGKEAILLPSYLGVKLRMEVSTVTSVLWALFVQQRMKPGTNLG